jgi:hypothetical protein
MSEAGEKNSNYAMAEGLRRTARGEAAICNFCDLSRFIHKKRSEW